jgi:hypothetical protein
MFSIYNKLLIFIHGFKINARSPLELRSIINEPVSSDAKTEDEIVPVLSTYELRGRRVEKSVIPETKYETLTFKHFFSKLIKTFKIFDLNENPKTFLTQI